MDLGAGDTFTMLSLLIYEHGGLLYSFRCLLISFITFCSFQHRSPIHILLDLHLSDSVLNEYKWYCIFNFVFYMFIASIQKCICFSFVHCVSCKLAELPYYFLDFFYRFLEIFLYRRSHHLQIGRVLFPSFVSICLFQLFLPQCTGWHFQ